ncbi:CerR family C-terminal domain-containing protein [Pleomorphomonas sp. JP5]|uniref:CerR family C-terminal domain-containing protein n=1 Tax=Pleomorphomonas sp. JP5 TaxID=2942998 RepID=UPI002044ABC3|nr:CerR family C-terminal domain-containing protein [Pleomorphomonas sp. JP5]MCM5560378.1 CerR family C-terminal domain-containing protein [Pleomorphomonas sp. JP5]
MTKPPSPDTTRNDGTREKLLLAALDLFGQYGFEGVSTRKLAELAGVNLQAINYYFGNKRGLYNAVADYLIERLQSRIGERRKMVLGRFAEAQFGGRPIDVEEARAILTVLGEAMLTLFADDESAVWVRYMVREQAEPTEAYDRIYTGFMQPMLTAVRHLVSILLEADPDSERVRLRTLSLIGSLIVYRVGRATILREMGWSEVGSTETATIRSIAGELVASIHPIGESAT